MARKIGQIVRRGVRAWLVRVYNGRNSETEKRKIPERDHPRRVAGRPSSSQQNAQRARSRPECGIIETNAESVPGWLAWALRQTSAAGEEAVSRRPSFCQ